MLQLNGATLMSVIVQLSSFHIIGLVQSNNIHFVNYLNQIISFVTSTYVFIFVK